MRTIAGPVNVIVVRDETEENYYVGKGKRIAQEVQDKGLTRKYPFTRPKEKQSG